MSCSTLSLRGAEVVVVFVELIAEGLAGVASLEPEPILEAAGSTVLFLSFMLELGFESSPRGLLDTDVSVAASCSQSLERDRRWD